MNDRGRDDGLPAAVEADELQRACATRVIVRALGAPPRTVAAVDAAYLDGTVYAAAVLFRLAPLQRVEERLAERKCGVPYLPGYFQFREGPALLAALGALSQTPDLLLVEGQGIAHPRRCGIASHIGVALGIPTIGCAKTRLIGEYAEPGRQKGCRSALMDGEELIGAVVRTRTDVKPLFVSVGHLITLEEAISLVLSCCGAYRVPEPLRAADMAARLGRVALGAQSASRKVS